MTVLWFIIILRLRNEQNLPLLHHNLHSFLLPLLCHYIYKVLLPLHILHIAWARPASLSFKWLIVKTLKGLSIFFFFVSPSLVSPYMEDVSREVLITPLNV